jgi:hypothetical protein
MTLSRTAFAFALGVALTLTAAAPAAMAGVVYNFTFTPGTTDTGTPIEAFSFSFTEPGFITSTSDVSFTTFDMTDGANSDAITFGEATDNGDSSYCFDFVSSSNQLSSGCGLDASSEQGYVDFVLSGQLPTALGVYTDTSGIVLLDYSGNSFDRTYGTLTLDVTSSATPEPATFGLAGVGAMLACLIAARRLRSTP